MAAKFVKVVFDLYCDWEGFPPEYQLYVNDELFTERTYDISPPEFVREMLQVEGEPGEYKIVIKKISPQSSEFRIENAFIKYGPGEVLDNTRFRIL